MGLNLIKLFFKTQWQFLFKLMGVFVLPLILFFEFSPYPLPKIEFAVLGALIVFQFLFFKEKNFFKNYEIKAKQDLANELGRVPSRQEVVVRLSRMVDMRHGAVVLCSVALLITTFIYGKI